MATEGSIEQTFVQLEDGIRRLTLPLPTGPKHVHCYLAGGTLFDTGLGLADAPWSAVEAERIAITHFHPDHVGGAEAAARATSTMPSASACGEAPTGPNGSPPGSCGTERPPQSRKI
jgi:glyoxylase-like metal-dependent hydrolase (beta-lactamase superfamily II)